MIKNDKWIAEKAKQGMILPFQDKLIRHIENRSDQTLVPTISYGLSSFGYDIRLSPKEFKIFRHIPGQIVDPKFFNPENLEPVALKNSPHGDYFILPGHSYGLGVALEYLNIPDNITVLCIGKSTYARCFTGDTKVKLVNGDFNFIELIEKVEQGERLYGYGINNGQIEVQELIQPRLIEMSNIVRVYLDNNQYVDCTPDHKFLLRNGEKIAAGNLKSGMSLHPIYEYKDKNYPEFKEGNLGYNHKVLQVEELTTQQPVYCLTAPKTGNFALSAGVFVENCGIIANLTPVEAGWRGHLTLELSNSSSADCRIYANEGIVQLLFFEGEPCETSYATRRGKYQDQPESVVVAKAG